MSGLFVSFGEHRDPASLAAHAARLGAGTTDTFRTGTLFVHAVGNLARSPHAESPRTFVYVFGALYRKRAADDAGDGAFVLSRYEAGGAAALEQLNGSFLAVVLDRDTSRLTIVNDRSGSVLAYVRSQGTSALALATHCKCFLGLDGFSPALNTDSMVAHLMFGRVKVTQAPFFEGITPLPPGSLLRAEPGSTARITRYYQYRDHSQEATRSPDEWTDRAIATLREIISERLLDHERLAFSLSGGIDSRVMIATIPPDLYSRMVGVSFGMAGNDESAIAKLVADELGAPYVDVTLSPRDFLADAEAATEISEGQDMFLQGFVLRFLDSLRRSQHVDAIMDGMEVGVSLGGDYLRPSFHDVRPETLPDFLFQRFYIHNQAPADIFRVDARAAGERLIESMLDEIRDIEGVYDKMDWIYVECYTREVMRQRHRFTRERLEGIPIAVDTRYLDLVTSIPGPVKEGRQLQLDILRKARPSLLDIVYHLTMVPLSASRDAWNEGKARVAAHEAAAQDAWRTSRTHLPYNHYYTNFSEWLRVDPDMLAFVGDLLVSDSCRISRQLVHRDWMLRVIREHQAGEADHRSTIQYLLTLELFLRTFGEG